MFRIFILLGVIALGACNTTAAQRQVWVRSDGRVIQPGSADERRANRVLTECRQRALASSDAGKTMHSCMNGRGYKLITTP
ncbi:hypothetical protein IMF23_18205 [Chelatococcus daeguensis]|uniref:hypothetical protein n=1 Tax=Chelatococcus TaxID=28209 RepID=UPI0007ABBB99|nr:MULTISPECIES: hypothetical protein [Chelatococcus]KZE35389.1 hypothetical protein AVW15_14130 [Chelatococcus daeguensis]MBM3085374.1 hypothetical protein [Chelatococcus daeguensis]